MVPRLLTIRTFTLALKANEMFVTTAQLQLFPLLR